MPRSSRHRSHRSHKHGPGDHSGSEDGGLSKERKLKDEDLLGETGAEVSRDLESEKRKTSHSSQEKESHGASNGHASAEHGKKRKERAEDPTVSDRWKSSNGDDLMDEKRSSEQIFGPIDVNKSSNLKHSKDGSKSRSRRRQEGPNQRNEESGPKVETGKQRSDKDSSWRENGDRYKEERTELNRRESGHRYKDRAELSIRESSDQYKEERVRERERKKRERGLDRDKIAQDAKHHRPEDTFGRKNNTKAGRKGHMPRKDSEITENHIKEELYIPVIEKDFEKRTRRRRNGSEGDDDDRKIYYGDDNGNSRSSKDHRSEGQKYKDKYRDDADRDRRYRDERRQDDHFSGYHTSDWYDTRNSKNESKLSESRYKKSQLHDKDDYGNIYDDYSAKDRDIRVRKRFSEDEDHTNLKPRSAKDQCRDTENASSSRLDCHIERPITEHQHSDRVDSSPSKKHKKSSPNSGSYQGKDQSRRRSKPTDSASKEPLYEERVWSRTSSERIIESRPLDKLRSKDDVLSNEQAVEGAAASQYDSLLILDKQTSANQATDKSPSRNELRFTGLPSANYYTKYKDRESDLSSEKPVPDYRSQSKVGNRQLAAVGSSSINRNGNFSVSSPNRHLQHPSRLRSDELSLFGSYDNDNRIQIGDRKNHSHLKRSDLSAGQGCGNAWNNPPAWPPSIANGFLPLQHGPRSGFHPAVQQFPGPPLFCIRPPMSLSNARFPFHMHDAVDRYFSHVRAFGWPNPVDEPRPPHLQLWDGNNDVYGRPEWDRNMPIAGNGGWETSADTWKVQDNTGKVKFPVPQKELELEKPAAGQPGHQSRLEQHGSECLPTNNVEANNDASRVESVFKSPSKIQLEKKTNGDTRYCGNYLSKVNISSDLAGSEIYVRCITTLKSLSINGECGALSDGCSQKDIKKESAAKAQGMSKALLNLLFSSNGHSVFQRAMSLYKKQTGTLKEMLPCTASLCSQGNKNLPKVHCEQERSTDSASIRTLLVNTDLNADSMEEETPSEITDPSTFENAPYAGSILHDHAIDMADAGGDHPVNDEGKQSDLAADGDLFNSDSQDCEAITTETVNSSSPVRNSEESTH